MSSSGRTNPFPHVPPTTEDVQSLKRAVDALTVVVETLVGIRGTEANRAVLVRDLSSLEARVAALEAAP